MASMSLLLLLGAGGRSSVGLTALLSAEEEAGGSAGAGVPVARALDTEESGVGGWGCEVGGAPFGIPGFSARVLPQGPSIGIWCEMSSMDGSAMSAVASLGVMYCPSTGILMPRMDGE